MQKLTMGTVALALTGVALAGLAAPAAAQGQAQSASRRSFDIPAQDMAGALEIFGRQAGRDIMFDRGQVAGLRSATVRGMLEPGAALRRLVGASGLPIAAPNPSTFVVGGGRRSGEVAEDSGDGENSQIVITGTRIRGAEVSSPIVTLSRDEMRLSGRGSLGEVFRALPQNFSGGQNPGVTGASAGGLANQNLTGGTSLNLRGLGPDATLTLLNGARLPFDGYFQATDVSIIPVAAISRVDVFLDGASAIYGADAVGGVANIVLRRDYEGAEATARYGRTADGGGAETRLTALAGATWGSGGFLASAEGSRTDPILARDRDYLAAIPNQNVTIYPDLRQKGFLFSGHHLIGNLVELTLDAFYTERQQDTLEQSTSRVASRRDSTIYGISPAVALNLPGDWSLRVSGFLGRNEAEFVQDLFSITSGARTFQDGGCYCNRAKSIGIEAEGPIVSLPGGDLRVALGAGYRRNSFARVNLAGVTATYGVRRSRYAFGEVNLPLVSQELGIAGVRRLVLSGAVRHEDYGDDDFGAVTTPKVGLIWEPIQGLDVRANWGRSFKTPQLQQEYGTRIIQLFPSTFFGVPGAGNTVLALQGPNRNLGPERAEIFTAGAIARPALAPGLRVELGYFDIKYDARIILPINPTEQALLNPAFVQFVTLNPSLDMQNALFAVSDRFSNNSGGVYDPSRVIAFVDNRYTNAAAQRVRGVDLSISYTTDLFGGRMTSTGSATWLHSRTRLNANSLAIPTSGMAYYPASFRGRAGATWSRGGLTLASFLHYTRGLRNAGVNPPPRGDSLVTVDLVADYVLSSPVLGEWEFNLSAINLFNREPPALRPLQNYQVSYDSTNYSAVGRMLSIAVTKRF